MYQTFKFNTRSWSLPSHRPTTRMSSQGKTWPWKSVWQRPECRLVNLTFVFAIFLGFFATFLSYVVTADALSLRCWPTLTEFNLGNYLWGCVIITKLVLSRIIMHYHHNVWAIVSADMLSSQSWTTLIQFNPWNSCGSVCLFNSTWQVET